jgi:phosphate uptake regulator
MSVEDVHKTTITELQRLRALAMDRALQEYKKSLQEELKGVDARIDELKKEIEQRTVYSGSHRA